ncbi:MAG: prepilin-type N-terminal cleavage/methylation domain-containing protein [Deltaproteobacteria bacterium]|nr:prepilin-type N-terminal cleavage/methylation domain-containing protein [Deltaproteobacteria bacterium]
MSASSRKQLGFTLIEIVLAVSILAVVLATAYSALTQILNVKTALDDNRDVTVVANSLIRRLTRELQLAVAENPILFRDQSGSQGSAAIYFFAEAGSAGRGSQDKVTFIAQEAGQYLPDGGTHTGLVQVTYRMERDPEKRSESEQYLLIREEIPYIEPSGTNLESFQKAKDKAFSKVIIFPITDSITSLRLRYYDDEEGEWRSEWNQSRREAIPALIQLTFSLRSPRGHDYSYSTIIPVQAGIGRFT